MSDLPKVSACPYCNYIADRVTLAPVQKVQPGDVAICHACGGMSIISETLGLRLPTELEILEIRSGPDWPRVREISQKIGAMKDRPKPPRHS
jgi:hypothetical protein